MTTHAASHAPSTTTYPAKHPPGIYLLFIVEMWERFSYYGMRALLVLFLVAGANKGGFGWSESDAAHLYGYYTGLVYLTPIIGGWLADRFLGTHRSMVIGGLVIAAGHFSLAMDSVPTFYLGLGLLIVGTGFFKPCVSTMVGSLYDANDPKRDAGFTIFYMGTNFGALIGTLICGYLGESERFGWHWGFGAAGVGMVLGLLVYVVCRPKYLAGVGLPTPHAERLEQAKSQAKLTRAERDQIIAILIVAFFVIFFWMAYEQAGSSMNLFALNSTQRELFGISIPASWFQTVNPAVILLLGPVMAWLWPWLGRRNREPSTPVKMAAGLVLLALGFFFMVGGAMAAKDGQLASPLWLVGAYTLHTVGELCLSPVGLSFVSKLAPLRFASLLMGIWFLANFAANLLAGYLAGAEKALSDGSLFHVFGGGADFYLVFVVTSAVAGVLLLAMSPYLHKLMHGKE